LFGGAVYSRELRLVYKPVMLVTQMAVSRFPTRGCSSAAGLTLASPSSTRAYTRGHAHAHTHTGNCHTHAHTHTHTHTPRQASGACVVVSAPLALCLCYLGYLGRTWALLRSLCLCYCFCLFYSASSERPPGWVSLCLFLF
jgi:hypothetical protein